MADTSLGKAVKDDCVPGPARLGLCLDKSRRCTVQGHRRLARVPAMCVHSCVSWQAGRPVRPLRPLSALLCSSAAGGRVVSRLAPDSGRLRPGRPGLAAGGRSATPSPAGGAGSAPVTGAGGWGWGGGRQAIHLLLLQRNGAARAPAHLSSASFADNRHLSSLSSANVISAADSGRGHRRMGLLDTRSCIYTLAHETWGGHMGPGGGAHVSVCMWIRTP